MKSVKRKVWSGECGVQSMEWGVRSIKCGV